MIPAGFDYVRASSARHALDLLAEHGDSDEEDAKLLAGGHSLLPLMKLRLAVPGVLVDIGHLDELRYIRVEGDEVVIGALTRDRELERSDMLRTECPLLAHVAAQVGDPQVRARGTLGGSLVHGDSASDLPTAVLALGGTLVIQGPAGTRTVDAGDFFQGFFTTAVGEDELLTEIRLPRTGGLGWAYEKFTRRANDWPIAAAAVIDGRVALANSGPTVLRAAATEAALAAGASNAEAAAVADEGTSPSADMHGGVDYRRHLTRTLVHRALDTAGA